MKRNYDKKAAGAIFYMLIFVVVAILLGEIAIFYVSSNTASVDDFGKTFSGVDIIYAKNPALEFYNSENVRNSVERAKRSFSNSLGFTLQELSERINTCKYEGKELWYNERLPEDSDNDRCLPGFNEENIAEKLNSYLSNEVEDTIMAGLSGIGAKGSNIEIAYDVNEKSYKIEVDSHMLEENKIGKAYLSLDFSQQVNIESYMDLMLTLKNIIPKLSEDFSTSVPRCIKENQENSIENIEFYCIEKATNELIKKEAKTNLKEYSIKISRFDVGKEENEKDHFGLKFEVMNNVLKKKEFEINAIIKDTIPHNLVNFRIENYPDANNIIKVTIEEPKFADNIFSYIILYSYEDFFDENEYKAYDELINMLKNSKIPQEFEDTQILLENYGKFYHSNTQNNMELSLLAISPTGFSQNENLKTKSIPIYQIYDFKENKIKLLEEGKKLHVFVFAVDFNHNYYVDAVTGKTKQVIVESPLGPEPLDKDKKVTVSGDIASVQDSFLVKIEGYEDNDFNHYDIYIKESGFESYENCENNECLLIDGKDKLIKQNANYLITSDMSMNSLEGYDIVKIGDYLKSNKKYDIKIVPVDNKGRSITDRIEVKAPIPSADGTYYVLNNNNKLPAEYKGENAILIKDKKIPDPMTSIRLSSPTIVIDPAMNMFKWEPVESDVDRIYVSLTFHTSTGDTIPKGTLLVGKDKILHLTGNFKLTDDVIKIEATKVLPMDINNNKATDTQQTQTAVWVK